MFPVAIWAAADATNSVTVNRARTGKTQNDEPPRADRWLAKFVHDNIHLTSGSITLRCIPKTGNLPPQVRTRFTGDAPVPSIGGMALCFIRQESLDYNK